MIGYGLARNIVTMMKFLISTAYQTTDNNYKIYLIVCSMGCMLLFRSFFAEMSLIKVIMHKQVIVNLQYKPHFSYKYSMDKLTTNWT